MSFWDHNRIFTTSEQTEQYFARKEKVTIVIPAFNEANGIKELIEAIIPYGDEILLVDGHSTDDTFEIARKTGIVCVKDNKKGKGDAIRTSLSHATHDIIVFIDADFSHDPRDIPRLVLPILSGEYSHVVASRPKGGSDEAHGDFNKFARMIGSDIITLSINYRFDVRLSDSQNGFRALRKKLAIELDLKENITSIEQEMTIKTLAKGYKILEVPIHEYARKHGKSKIKLRRVSLRYVYSALKYLITG